MSYYLYIMASRSKTLYVGVTNNLERRAWEHKTGFVDGFTKRYNIHKLVYYEDYGSIRDAIAREKQIKAWRRQKKVDLIESINPEWDDIAEHWYLSSETPHFVRGDSEVCFPPLRAQRGISLERSLSCRMQRDFWLPDVRGV